MLSRFELQAVRDAIRAYMRLPVDDDIDLVVLAAIMSNFAPDRVNPLWFVLIASPESGKSTLLDVILDGWTPVWSMPPTLAPTYFSLARKGSALASIDRGDKRLLYMADMAGLLGLPQGSKAAIHTQMIALYDGALKHDGRRGAHIHKRGLNDRLGWIGSATEVFYERFLQHTYPVGSRFTAFYWRAKRAHWSDHGHLEEQRDMRERRLSETAKTNQAARLFLDRAVKEMKDFPKVRLPKAQGARLDAATALVMRIAGGDLASPGGRTADRAAQFVRTVAFLSGEMDVEPHHADLGVQLVLSQLPPRYQHIIGYAIRPENIETPWRFMDFLREIGGRRLAYTNHATGPLDNMIDIGILEVVRKGGGKGSNFGHNLILRVSPEALQLVAKFDPRCAELQRYVAAEPEPEPSGFDDAPAEISLDALDVQ